jgi:hypothetical protein
MSQRGVLLLRNGLVGGCAFAAIVLLASFYSIVSGAVDRAARHRLAADPAVAAAAPAAVMSRTRRPSSLLARSDN